MRSLVRVAPLFLLILSLSCIGLGIVLDLGVNPLGPGEARHWTDALWVTSFVGFPIVGALIATKLPGNGIGWLLCGIGAAIGLAVFSGEFAQYALVVREGAVPAGEVFAWLNSWVHLIAVVCLLLLLIFFPQGRPRTRLWSWISYWVVVATLGLIIMYALRPGPLDSLREISNPLGLDGFRPVMDALIPLLGNSLAIVMLAVIVDKFRFFMRASGEERQQVKGFALAALSFPLLFASSLLIEAVLGKRVLGDFDPVVVAFFVGFNGLAAAIGMAILKHRLYDIDVIINRTLVYGVLTAALLTSYLLIVVSLSRVLDPIARDSDIAVAASTLAVAALFRPLRARIQGFIDRRFYRARYDASRAVAMFAARLRDEIEVDTVRSDVLDVIGETVQPRHASVWLRQEAEAAR